MHVNSDVMHVNMEVGGFSPQDAFYNPLHQAIECSFWQGFLHTVRFGPRVGAPVAMYPNPLHRMMVRTPRCCNGCFRCWLQFESEENGEEALENDYGLAGDVLDFLGMARGLECRCQLLNKVR